MEPPERTSFFQRGRKLAEFAESTPRHSVRDSSRHCLSSKSASSRQRGSRTATVVSGLGVCADKADKSESVEIRVFLLFSPCVLGHPEASGRRSRRKEVPFWGHQNGGARTQRRQNGEAEPPQTAGRGNWPEAVPRIGGLHRRTGCLKGTLHDASPQPADCRQLTSRVRRSS